MIKAIIFDCFGVLIGKGFWDVYEKLGGDLEADKTYIDIQLDKVNSEKISSEQFSREMAKRIGVPVGEYKLAFKNDEIPNEEVFDFIKLKLAGKYKLALVSNATGNSVRNKIPEDKLNLFDEVLISAEVKLLKPDPKLFNLALTRLGALPSETIFVDDHQRYIDGAHAAGLKTVLFMNVDDLASKLQAYIK